MKLLLTMLVCLIAASAGAQTIKSLGYNTTNGQVVYSGTNTLRMPDQVKFGTNSAAIVSGSQYLTLLDGGGGVALQLGTNRITVYDEIAFGGVSGTALSNAATTRTNFGLGGTNTVTFSNLQLNSFPGGGSGGFVGRNGNQLALYGTNVSSSVPAFYGWDGFNNAALSAGTSRTNLGLGATNNVTFSNITATGTLGVSNAATFATNVSINTLTSIQTNSSGFSEFRLTLPNNANVLRITVPYSINRIDNGRIGAFYYLINESGSPLVINSGNGITIQGGSASLTLGANQAATLVATGATNVSVAARGDLTDVALGGTANTAPSQTASSGASLMTRDLIYQSAMDFNSSDMMGIQSTLVSGAGAGSSQFNTLGWQVSVTTNTNTAAGAYFGDMLWSQSSFSGALMPANKVVDCTLKGVMIRVETNTNFVNRIVFGTGVPNRVPPAAGNPAATNQGWGVNFFYNGTNQVAQPFWYTTNYNTSANIIVTNLSDGNWSQRVFTLRFQQTTNGQISFYINDGLAGRLSSTPTWTTNVTWPSAIYGGRYIAMECATATNAAPVAGARMHFRNAYIKYDP